MVDFLIIGIPVLIAIVAIGITALLIGVQLARLKRRRHLLQYGEMAVADEQPGAGNQRLQQMATRHRCEAGGRLTSLPGHPHQTKGQLTAWVVE